MRHLAKLNNKFGILVTFSTHYIDILTLTFQAFNRNYFWNKFYYIIRYNAKKSCISLNYALHTKFELIFGNLGVVIPDRLKYTYLIKECTYEQ